MFHSVGSQCILDHSDGKQKEISYQDIKWFIDSLIHMSRQKTSICGELTIIFLSLWCFIKLFFFNVDYV